MTRTALWRATLMLLLASFARSSLPAPTAQRSVAAFRITGAKTMLFYGQTGMFSPDLFGPSAPTLQNVSTGEGQAIATLVVVEVTGRPDAYAPTRKVAFTATAGKRVLLNSSVAIGRPGDDGKFHTAFWIYEAPCTPLMLKARITGQTEVSTLEKTLNFKCGD
jgi:hypothetical protein